jgi:hypothetical protein
MQKPATERQRLMTRNFLDGLNIIIIIIFGKTELQDVVAQIQSIRTHIA